MFGPKPSRNREGKGGGGLQRPIPPKGLVSTRGALSHVTDDGRDKKNPGGVEGQHISVVGGWAKKKVISGSFKEEGGERLGVAC